MNFQYVKDFMNRLTAWVMPGNSICIYRNNREIFRYSSGYADLENKIPMTGDEYLNIYSCSKVATVTAALQLIERGHILLSDPLQEYIPEFKDVTVREADGSLRPAKCPITLYHLFTMTAGLDYNCNTPSMQKARELTGGKMDTLTVARCLAEEPLSFDPGAHWQYSLCHDVLAAVVEVVSGMRFCDYVQKNVFEPCGIQKAAYHITPAIEAHMAQQYKLDTGEDFDPVAAQSGKSKQGCGTVQNVGLAPHLTFGPEYDSGGAGIVTTVPEYAKLADALACGGRAQTGEQILAPGTVALLQKNALPEKLLPDLFWGNMIGYGYGLGVRTLMDKTAASSCGSVGEFGWGGAAGATLLADPSTGLSFFYAHHMLNPQEAYYQPRLRNVVYAGLSREDY